MRDITSHALNWKFRDMPPGMLNRWIKWAQSHDWCESAAFYDGNLHIASHDEAQVSAFTNPQELRDWAGY